MKKKKIVGKAVRVFLVLALAGCLVLFLVNLYIIRKEENTLFPPRRLRLFRTWTASWCWAAAYGRTAVPQEC